MKKLLLALLLSIVTAAPAFAACTPGFIATPGSGANQTFSTKAAGDTNCESLIDEDTSSQFHTDLNTLHTDLGTLNTTAGNPLAAGTNTIGSVKRTDGTNIVLTDPCQGVAKTYTPINISASGSVKIITGTAAKKTYVCHIDIVTNAANNVLLSEGTGTNCATGTQGIIGGTTAASGWNFSANGGISLGMGGFAVLQAWNATGDDVCLNPSASTQLSGMVAWVQQ